MTKKLMSVVLMGFIICLRLNVIVLAEELRTLQYEVKKILQQTVQVTTEDGDFYQILIVPQEEEEYYLTTYAKSLSDPRKKNILPNLIMFSYLRSTYSVTIKVTNIALDSLDFAYGHVNLYYSNGLCGSGMFGFYNIPAMQSDYITVTSSVPWEIGVLFADASDGTETGIGSGVFYFSP